MSAKFNNYKICKMLDLAVGVESLESVKRILKDYVDYDINYSDSLITIPSWVERFFNFPTNDKLEILKYMIDKGLIFDPNIKLRTINTYDEEQKKRLVLIISPAIRSEGGVGNMDKTLNWVINSPYIKDIMISAWDKIVLEDKMGKINKLLDE